MTVGPLVSDAGVVGAAFANLRRLKEEIDAARIENVSMEHLSMGMTDDFEIAIAEGSTMIRLGRILFGEVGRRRRATGRLIRKQAPRRGGPSPHRRPA